MTWMIRVEEPDEWVREGDAGARGRTTVAGGAQSISPQPHGR